MRSFDELVDAEAEDRRRTTLPDGNKDEYQVVDSQSGAVVAGHVPGRSSKSR